MSNLIVSFGESSNLCILGIIFLGSYLAFIFVRFWCLSCSSWQDQVVRKRFYFGKLVAFSVEEILLVYLWGRFHTFPCVVSLLYLVALVVLFPTELVSSYFAFLYGSSCRSLSDRVGLILFGVSMHLLLQFWYQAEILSGGSTAELYCCGMFALRYPYRSCPWEKIGVHVLDSRR